LYVFGKAPVDCDALCTSLLEAFADSADQPVVVFYDVTYHWAMPQLAQRLAERALSHIHVAALDSPPAPRSAAYAQHAASHPLSDSETVGHGCGDDACAGEHCDCAAGHCAPAPAPLPDVDLNIDAPVRVSVPRFGGLRCEAASATARFVWVGSECRSLTNLRMAYRSAPVR
jgi:hypothetical protein